MNSKFPSRKEVVKIGACGKAELTDKRKVNSAEETEETGWKRSKEFCWK